MSWVQFLTSTCDLATWCKHSKRCFSGTLAPVLNIGCNSTAHGCKIHCFVSYIYALQMRSKQKPTQAATNQSFSCFSFLAVAKQSKINYQSYFYFTLMSVYIAFRYITWIHCSVDCFRKLQFSVFSFIWRIPTLEVVKLFHIIRIVAAIAKRVWLFISGA